MAVTKNPQLSFEQIYELLKKTYPQAHCALNFKSPWELLVATILSAQCTDKRVNMVTPILFAKYPTIKEIAKAKPADLEKIIHSTGFYRNKTKSIISSAQKIITNYKGQVPEQLEQLITLPGVARKTANVVLWNAFGKNEGIVVDTHVKRVAFRLGWTKATDPNKIEIDLMKLCPKNEWGQLSHYLIDLGRDVCKAPTPNCGACRIQSACPWYKNIISKKR